MREIKYTTLNQGRYVITFADGGRTTRARLVAAVMTGRELQPKEIVHHINGDATDDRFSNLLVVTRQQHAAVHKQTDTRLPFNSPPKPQGLRSLTIHLSAELKEELRKLAKREGRGLDAQCRVILQKAVDETKYRLSLED
jgi:hypothetical protein